MFGWQERRQTVPAFVRCVAHGSSWHQARSSTPIPALIIHRSSNLLCQKKALNPMGWLGTTAAAIHLVHLYSVTSPSRGAGKNSLSARHRETSLLLKPLIYSLHGHQLLFPLQDGARAKFRSPSAVTLAQPAVVMPPVKHVIAGQKTGTLL